MAKAFPNSRGNVSFLKKRLEANLAAGEKVVGSEFWMEIEGYPEVSILIRTTQLPEMTREDVEDYMPSGIKFSQAGVLRNQTEFQMQCAETIDGVVLQAFKKMILNKEYVNINFFLAPETYGGERSPIRKMQYCRLGMDAVDFSSDDVTQAVRPSIRVICNWQE